ncbi:pyruvate formate lyase activating enzyme [Treponema bryantii]|uniref:Pyruvate formate lyase activating enzyme n=1 Tax=Treponema bryantii TaxID=163 RepID=A0A1H9HBL4_9SPIR|nr:AmmeMemoRadiSam system radical SAM enzyme [Treponema bryantii]SEQ59741.1 pyruvate formate lyase activating enzyme [Treponema bryantii]
MAICDVCFRQCKIEEGSTGFCGARTCRDGKIVAANYGRLTSIALDPIEKKPLKMFHPGSQILSLGSYGCNLRCPFCQNYSISWSQKAFEYKDKAEYYAPEEIVKIASDLRPRGNIGLAFTYNEPLIGYEFIRDTAKRSNEAGMQNVLVTNGTATLKVLNEISPYIDAMNIDLKTFTTSFYKDFLDGDFQMVKDFIQSATASCHVELTTLIIPDENDSEEEMRELSAWVAQLENQLNKKIPLHITRFFPTFKLTDREPTPVNTIMRLVEVAKENLEFVFPGNI